MIACHRQRRQVADRTTGHEAPTGTVRQTRQVGEESQHLVLRADRTGCFEPRLRRERRCPDGSVHPHRGRGRRGRDERQEPLAVEADGRRHDDLGKAPPRLLVPEAGPGDGAGQQRVELPPRRGAPERRVRHTIGDERRNPFGDRAEIDVRTVDRQVHSGVTYAAVIPPSMINDWPVIH